MALARVKVVNPGDTILSADWNNEFNNILNNPISLVSPTTGAINFQTSVSHTNLVPSAITASSGTAGQALIVSTGLTSLWGAVSAAPSLSLVRGLIGTVTSSQTATLSADQYVLQTTAGTPVFFTLNSTASFTVNVGTAGPIANGRDVAAAFSSTFVHLYAITTGGTSTTPAGIASTTPPPTGPSMPSTTGYSAWSYLGTAPYSSASTTFTAGMRVRGESMLYEAFQNALNAGAASSETAVNLASLVPAVALRSHLSGQWNATGAQNSRLRVISGSDYFRVHTTDSATNRPVDWTVTVPNVSQQVFYLHDLAPSVGFAFFIDVNGYVVPNGSG